jgi:hypothetical protein
MDNIFTINDDILEEWSVKPNELLSGWHILTEVDRTNTEKYLSVRGLMPGALERDRFESVKMQEEGYVGLGNIVYYKSKEEAEEVLNLRKQFKR